VEAKDNDGWTPLHYASCEGHLTVVQYLVEQAGATVEATNKKGQTPLDVAREKKHSDIVQFLEKWEKQLPALGSVNPCEWTDFLERPVFLSHTGADPDAATFAAFVGAKLQDKYEIDSFLDSKTLDAGDIWRHKIETHAKRCKVFVAILSKHYFERFWCLHELDLAFRNNCIVIPVYFVDPNPSGDKKEIHKVEIPKATNTEFADKLGRMLAEKQLEEDSSVVLRRWWTNMTALDAIHGMRHYSVHKHWMNDFCNQVAEEVHNQLLEEH